MKDTDASSINPPEVMSSRVDSKEEPERTAEGPFFSFSLPSFLLCLLLQQKWQERASHHTKEVYPSPAKQKQRRQNTKWVDTILSSVAERKSTPQSETNGKKRRKSTNSPPLAPRPCRRCCFPSSPFLDRFVSVFFFLFCPYSDDVLPR